MWAGVVAGLVSLSGSVAAPLPDLPRDPALEVPFVAQGPLLCGGAAAAMVERYWGARGIYGEDFAHLVRETEGGIRASELTAALRGRGYEVEVIQGRPGAAFQALESGVPPILLLESSATSLHYVVLVDRDDAHAWFHDPNFGPRRRVALDELHDRWTASGYWTLLAVPSETGGRADAGGPGDGSAPPMATRAGASGAAPPAAALEAMERLRSRDFASARAAARTLVSRGTADADLGRRILATAWFLDDEPELALGEWNALGEPSIDLVHIDGTRSTRFQVAATVLGVEHGEVLTPGALRLARRRLARLPSVEASRVGYRPLPEGTVEVQATVVERPAVPGALALAVQGGRGLVHQRAAMALGPFLSGGERWSLSGSWARAQRYVGWTMAAPAPPLPGVVTVGMEGRQEGFGIGVPRNGSDYGEVTTERRTRGFLKLEEWVTADFRFGGTVGLESWDVPAFGSPGSPDATARAFHGALTFRLATEDDGAWLELEGAGWTGSAPSFGRVSLKGGTDVSTAPWRAWHIRAGAATVTAETPLMLWPGAGTGLVREPLLRAHPLSRGGVIHGPSLGRTLVHGTLEHRVSREMGPVRLGAALFADAAHVRFRADGLGNGTFLDLGAGVFMGTGHREVAVSFAHGASGWRWSAQMGG